MSDSRIFLVSPQGETLTAMNAKPYSTEDVLQAFLERYPELLPGDQINPDNPRRWLLVAREMPVPGAETETGRWSLDHLLLDQDGIPTFVECKRASDTRARREVVAQMLDYAANGLEYWSTEKLRQAALKTAQQNGKELDEELRRVLDNDPEAEVDFDKYWQTVAANLEHGKVRLVFVADQTTKELRRLVEFLNEKLDDVQVLAVEIKQFLGGGQTALVPRVLGVTEMALEKKATGRGTTTQENFLSQCTPEMASFFEKIFALAQEHRFKISWGQKGFSLRFRLPSSGQMISFAYGYPPDTFDLYFGYLPWPDVQIQQLRQEIAQPGAFVKMGQKTLRAKIAEITSESFQMGWSKMVGKMDELLKTG